MRFIQSLRGCVMHWVCTNLLLNVLLNAVYLLEDVTSLLLNVPLVIANLRQLVEQLLPSLCCRSILAARKLILHSCLIQTIEL